jgi:hypothetical protein
MTEVTDELDIMDPMRMSPAQFAAAVREAIDEEVIAQRFAEAHVKIFEAAMPLGGVTKQAVELRKKETFLKHQLNVMKDELDSRKKLESDGKLLPRGLFDMLTGADDAAAASDSSQDYESDDDDEYDGGEDSTDEDSSSQRIAPSFLRNELLDSGVPAPVLSLDLGALPKQALLVARLVNEIVCVPYRGESCFLFALRPSEKDGDVSEVVRVLMRLSKHSTGDNLCRFVGAADYNDHVLVALKHSGGPTLARVARAASDGDLLVPPALQVMLALDLARAVSSLHQGGLVHGAVRPQVVSVTLHQPVTAHLLYAGNPSTASAHRDVRDLGLVFATLAFGRMVTADNMPSPAELRASSHGKDNPPFEAFCELIVQMTQSGDDSLRPTAAEAVVWLQAIADGENLDESACRLLQSTSLSSVPAIYELQRDHSPLRRY